MHSKITSAVVLTSLVSATNAFVPFKIKPLPADFDTRVWSPLTTITPAPSTASAIPSEEVTPAPALISINDEKILNIQTVANAEPDSDLRKRQGVQQAVPPVFSQVSPITTYQIDFARSGSVRQLTVVYTQTFNPIPDQWPSPTLTGSIGMGTITGQIGVVKTKRSLPTQAPMGSPPNSIPTEKVPAHETTTEEQLLQLLHKLRKAGEEATGEFSTLVAKVKTPSLKEIEDEIATLVHKIKKPSLNEFEEGLTSLLHKVKKPSFKDIEQDIVAIAKKLRLPGSKQALGSSSSTDSNNNNNAPFNFGPNNADKPTVKDSQSFSFGSDSDEPMNLEPEQRVSENSAPMTRTGGLAMLALVASSLFYYHL
ncbi:hypothetical protein PV10_04588 [Exophiala mesophila]|uniref:Uncharacterized protein n=1 Tax=Exophiala mesophila TaxID=212818 RepID=A0A0D1ZF46_EXOME|nr:uncharacterized protein PV10_04588 [Exophiala mesophila]KIV93372.1 hypothetical protein PV10_04588 [Exophiala mesophila]